MTKQQAYDPVTADFIGKLATSMPPMPGEIMHEWKPAELRRALMRSIGTGPKGTHVPRFPIARLDFSQYKRSKEDLLEAYEISGVSSSARRTDIHLKDILSAAFSPKEPKQVKRSRSFVGVFAEFIPTELRYYMSDNRLIPTKLFRWAQEIGLRPMTRYDALHLPGVLPWGTPWYTERQKIVPMFIPTGPKPSDRQQPLTAWHVDKLARMLQIEVRDQNSGCRSRLKGVEAQDIAELLQNPDTIMVFWS